MAGLSFEQLYAQAYAQDDYWASAAILEFTESIARLMKQKKISKSKLAQILGTSPAYVTKMLRGDTNFTMSSMVKCARALDSKLHIHVASNAADVRWFEVHKRSTAHNWALSDFDTKSEQDVKPCADQRSLKAQVDQPAVAA